MSSRLEFERRSLELTASQWTVLDEIAAQTASRAPSGPAAGQASWRTLIKRIAENEVVVMPHFIETMHSKELISG